MMHLSCGRVPEIVFPESGMLAEDAGCLAVRSETTSISWRLQTRNVIVNERKKRPQKNPH